MSSLNFSHVIDDELCKAVENSDFKKIESAFKQPNFNINALSSMGNALLHHTHRYNLENENCLKTFLLILSHPNININIQTANNGNTILHLASPDITKILLKNCRFNFNIKNNYGETAFFYKFKNFVELNQTIFDEKEIKKIINNLKLFIEKGAPFCDDHHNFRMNCIINLMAKINIYYDITLNFFKYLIKHPKFNINHQNIEGLTLLHLAKNKKMLEEILKVDSVDINIVNINKSSPLYYNIQQYICFGYDPFFPSIDFIEKIKFLLDYGADVNLYDKEGLCFVHYLLDEFLFKNQHLWDYIANHRRIIIEKNTADEYCLLQLTDNVEILKKLTKLPFQRASLIYALGTKDEELNNEIYQKWDQNISNNFIKIIIEKFLNSKSYPLYPSRYHSNMVYNLWKYLERKILPKGLMKDFCNTINLENDIFGFLKLSMFSNDNDIVKFLNMYVKYGNRNCLRRELLFKIEEAFGDCSALKKLIKLIPFSNLNPPPELLLDLTYYRVHCDVNLNLIFYHRCKKAVFSCAPLFSKKYLFNYLSIERENADYFIDSASKILPLMERNSIEHLIEFRKIFCDKPKTLKELSRNQVRLYLCNKYKIKYPAELENVLIKLGYSKILIEIVLLERPVNVF